MIRKFLFNTRIGSAVVAFLLLVALGGNAESINKPYDFPIKPGTPAWKAFKTQVEKLNACQVPDTLLKQMSTKALVMTCISYPLSGNFFVYDDFQMGFQRVSSRFNGLAELLKRTDLAHEALCAYFVMEDICSPLSKNIDERWRNMYLEMILAQPEVIGSLDTGRKMLLLRECIKKYTAKQASPYGFGILRLSPVCLVMGRTLKSLKDSNEKPGINLDEKMLEFIIAPGPMNWDIIERIAETADNVLKQGE
jgi:hypothetical protein